MPQGRHRTGFRGPSPEVGKTTQFQPGKSGNPGGRPKTKRLTDAYMRLLSNPANADKLAKVIFDLACQGNVLAAREIADRVEGRVLQGVRMEGELGVLGPEERKQRVLDILRAGAARVESVQ
jgi:hypothetical protein